MPFPIARRKKSTTIRVRVPDALSCRFAVLYSPRKEYAFADERWRDITRKWWLTQATSPVTGAVAELLATSELKFQMQRTAVLPADIAAEIAHARTPEWAVDIIPTASQTILIEAADSLLYPRTGLWSAYAAARAVMAYCGGIAYDLDGMRAVDRDLPFSKAHIAGIPRVRHFISISHIAGRRNEGRLLTGGMWRFGLPEIEIPENPLASRHVLEEILYGTAQKLVAESMTLLTSGRGDTERVHIPSSLQLSSGEPWVDVDYRNGTAPAPEISLPIFLSHVTDGPSLRGNGTGQTRSVIAIRPPTEQGEDPRGWFVSAGRLISGLPAAGTSTAESSLPPPPPEEMAFARRSFLAEKDDPHRLAVRYRVSTPYGYDYRWIVVVSWVASRLRGNTVQGAEDRPDFTTARIVDIDERDIVEIVWKSSSALY